MKVFISWSGKRSRKVAQSLRESFQLILNPIKPFMSDEDILPGARWIEQLNMELNETDTGIICLTKENVSAPWILFEAGSVSKSSSKVVPFLLDIDYSRLPDPLKQFASVSADETGTLSILESLHTRLGNQSTLSPEQLRTSFRAHWHATIKSALVAARSETVFDYDPISLLTEPRTEPFQVLGVGGRDHLEDTGYGCSIIEHYNDEKDPLISYICAEQKQSQQTNWHRLKAARNERPFEARYYVTSGKGEFEVGILSDSKCLSKKYVLGQGDSLLVPDSKWFRFKNICDSDLKLLIVCIPRWNALRFEVDTSDRRLEELPR